MVTLRILGTKRFDFNDFSTWHIMYEPEYRSDILAWLVDNNLAPSSCDKLVDSQGNVIWCMIRGRLIDTLLLNRAEDAILAALAWSEYDICG